MGISNRKVAYLVDSYQQARRDGMVWKWVLTHLLLFIAKCIFLYPILFIWRWTGNRTQDTVAHLIQFVLFSLVYYGALVILLTFPFQKSAKEQMTQEVATPWTDFQP